MTLCIVGPYREQLMCHVIIESEQYEVSVGWRESLALEFRNSMTSRCNSDHIVIMHVISSRRTGKTSAYLGLTFSDVMCMSVGISIQSAVWWRVEKSSCSYTEAHMRVPPAIHLKMMKTPKHFSIPILISLP